MALSSLYNKKNVFLLFWALIFLLGLYLRMSGLFRGLSVPEYIYHPDEPKQILALFNFLNGDYIHYYGSLFYDGYPYGLNHLDEYLLRPLLIFFGLDSPDRHSLYYYARLLRLVYSMAILAITYQLVYRLTNDKISSLLSLFLVGIAPLSITVVHFATGDIGVDLFCALCLLFVLFYLDKKHKKTWLFCSGIAVGAAFSAKYNGLLVGIVPAMVLCLEFLQEKNVRFFITNCFIIILGAMAGTVIFTPALLLDFSSTVSNIFANFTFVKDYNVPAEILAKPWIEKALLGLRKNTFYISSSLGYVVCLSSILSFLVTGRKYFACLRFQKDPNCSRNLLVLSIAFFPISSLLISLSGKYMVHPFHFSYLLVPLIVVTCVLFSWLYSSKNILVKGSGLLIIALAILEFGSVSWKENFFWRLEDNMSFEQNFAASIYSPVALATGRSGKIRSLYLEPAGNSVFRNRKHQAKGPDSIFWNIIQVAPLPQTPNPIKTNWIFINGPSFPRNERLLFVHGGSNGHTIKKYLVIPTGDTIAGFGVRSGSYATEAIINYGKTAISIELEAHQQKTVHIEPKQWKVSGGQTTDKKVNIIPLEISVPHDDIWVTILTNQKEKDLYTLYGGGQNGSLSAPERIPDELEQQLFSALRRVRYLETSTSWRVNKGKSIPMWEVALPAGHYKLMCVVNGLVDNSAIAVEFEDAKGELYRQQKQTFQIKKGSQQIEYHFTKPFAPYQTRFIISGVNGGCKILSFKLTPNYQKISDDFDSWRTSGVQPEWISRFSKKTHH